jgi:hypothetical protein
MTTNKNSKTTAQAALPTASAASESTRVETVTPELAAEWLTHNKRNRALQARAVKALVDAIKAGEWRMTHQGVAFGSDGDLYDGQHRLTAIVEAGVAVPMLVTRGLGRAALDAIDTGHVRKAHDVLSIADGIHIDHHRRAILIAANELVRSGTLNGVRLRANVHTLRSAMSEHGEDMDAVIAVSGITGRLKNAAVIAPLVITHRTLPRQTIEFAECFASGAEMAAGHPALALRNFVLVQYAKGGSPAARNDLVMRTFSAFDAFTRGVDRSFVKRSDAAFAKYTAPWRKSAKTA